MGTGYGTGYGSVPWGSFFRTPLTPDAAPPVGFDIYCFFDDPLSMGSILEDTAVTAAAAGGQLNENTGTYDLEIRSGGGAIPASTARVLVSSAVPATWTVQYIAYFERLPNDFSNLVSDHVFVGVTDAAGPCAGLFFSKAGVAYTGGVSHDGSGNLQLDSVLEPLPGSSAWVEEGRYIQVRVAADNSTGAVYVFITFLEDVPVIGQQLRAVLPVIRAAELANPPGDRTTISVRGTPTRASALLLDQLCLGSGLNIANLPPRAEAGKDQAARTCGLIQLDGSGSFDPEGVDLSYQWRFVDGPEPSGYVEVGSDGVTYVEAVPSGFTDQFYSAELGSLLAQDPMQMGDVLLVRGVPYTLTTSGVDGNGFFVRTATEVIPDDINSEPFKLLRNRALVGATTVKPTFYPDAPGIYKFDLIVSDGQLFSEASPTIVNVLESPLPRGIIPEASFVFDSLGSTWNLIEDKERLEVLFAGVMQVLGTEYLTLLQHDYSKSLRDIQRTFQRRWLHYDLLLPEPLPELTRTRQIRGGIESNIILDGTQNFQGSVLQVETPTSGVVSINFQLANPWSIEGTKTFLERKLKEVDPSFSVLEIPVASSRLRLNASVPFIIISDTSGLFTPGAINAHPSGTSGLRVGIRTYKVEKTLQGLGITEGDVLTVAGESYLISRVVDDPRDSFRFQRVVVQRDLPISPGAVWQIGGHVTSQLLNFHAGLVAAGDRVTFEVVNTVTGASALFDSTALGAPQLATSKLSVDLTPVDQFVSRPDVYQVRLARVLRRTRVPVNELVVDVPVLQERVAETDPSRALLRNVDFFIESFRGQRCIRFVTGVPDVWEGIDPPTRMWAETTFLDNRPTIESNFGIPAEFTLDDLASLATDVDYLSAVRGLWFTHLNGPTLRNLRVGTQILLGLPFAEEAGAIEQIRTDFSSTEGQILIRDSTSSAIVRSYKFPRELDLEINPTTGARYAVGDSVEQFAPLVEGAEVIDYVKDPRWFEGILNQGVFSEVEKYHRFLVRVDSAAFNLSALLFVNEFVLRVRPQYTRPLFVVRADVADSEVSVTDSVAFRGKLVLYDGACFPKQGMATMFDHPRAAGGGWFSDFDGDIDPTNAPVVGSYPTAESVGWGYDKNYLCPQDIVQATCAVAHPGGAVAYDSCFRYDEPSSPAVTPWAFDSGYPAGTYTTTTTL